MRTWEICLPPNRTQRWRGVTQKDRHRASWPLLTTSKILQPFRLPKNADNSLSWKILPLTLTRSRFCGASFKTTQSFQDFRGIPGGGGTPESRFLMASFYCRDEYYQSVNRKRSRVGYCGEDVVVPVVSESGFGAGFLAFFFEPEAAFDALSLSSTTTFFGGAALACAWRFFTCVLS